MPDQSLYEDLGVRPGATAAEINAAYRRSARQHHPDAGGDAEDFARISRAAVILRDPKKRARYDRGEHVDDQPDQTESVALQVLFDAFGQAMAQHEDLASADIIADVRKGLRDRQDNLGRKRVDLQRQRKRFDGALKRLKHKGKGANVLAGMIEGQRGGVDRQLDELDQAEASLRAALEMADGYAWDVDPQAARDASLRPRPQFNVNLADIFEEVLDERMRSPFR